VVQQAALQVLELVFEPTFHGSSHGFRPKRGAHTAIGEATGYLKDGYQTVIDLDWPVFSTGFIINACWPGSPIA
jgi:retron-type reverse transcriptase